MKITILTTTILLFLFVNNSYSAAKISKKRSISKFFYVNIPFSPTFLGQNSIIRLYFALKNIRKSSGHHNIRCPQHTPIDAHEVPRQRLYQKKALGIIISDAHNTHPPDAHEIPRQRLCQKKALSIIISDAHNTHPPDAHERAESIKK